MKIHVGSFTLAAKSKLPKVAISNSAPTWFKGPKLVAFVPSWWAVREFKAGKLTWDEFEFEYRSLLAGRAKAAGYSSFREWLAVVLQAAAKRVNSDEVVLCCWEKDPTYCHRSIIWEFIPEDMRGKLL